MMVSVREAANTSLNDVDGKLVELKRIRTGMKAQIASCRGNGALPTCPTLAALTQERSDDTR